MINELQFELVLKFVVTGHRGRFVYMGLFLLKSTATKERCTNAGHSYPNILKNPGIYLLHITSTLNKY